MAEGKGLASCSEETRGCRMEVFKGRGSRAPTIPCSSAARLVLAGPVQDVRGDDRSASGILWPGVSPGVPRREFSLSVQGTTF